MRSTRRTWAAARARGVCHGLAARASRVPAGRIDSWSNYCTHSYRRDSPATAPVSKGSHRRPASLARHSLGLIGIQGRLRPLGSARGAGLSAPAPAALHPALRHRLHGTSGASSWQREPDLFRTVAYRTELPWHAASAHATAAAAVHLPSQTCSHYMFRVAEDHDKCWL